MTEHVNLRGLAQAHGRAPSHVLEFLSRERFGDLGVPRSVADELSAEWQRVDAARTERELAEQRAAGEKEERQRRFREGDRLLEDVRRCRLDLDFTEKQIEHTSYVEDLERLEKRREAELDDCQAALDAWTAWKAANAEMAEAVQIAADKGLPVPEPAAFKPPPPNWLDEGVWR